MTTKAKILIMLLSFSLLLIFYLILTSEPANKSIQNKKIISNSINSQQLETSYKEQVKPIMVRYSELIKGNYTIDQVTQIKNKLLGLKMPAKFKNLHINLVLALTKMEDYLTNGENSQKVASQQIISQAKADYVWLNN